MSGRSTGPWRALALLLAASATAGCLGGPGRSNEGADRLALSAIVLEWDGEEVLVNASFDHIALYEQGRDDWVPLLTASAASDLQFAGAYGEPSLVTLVPLLAGTYTDIEVTVSKAILITEAGSRLLKVPREVCYAAGSLVAKGDDALLDLTLLIDGPAALDLTKDGGTFRPALAGSVVGGSTEGEAELDDPTCEPYA